MTVLSWYPMGTDLDEDKYHLGNVGWNTIVR